MSLGIRGRFVVGFDGVEHRIIRDGVVVVEGKRIRHVGKGYDGKVDRWIDAPTGLVMPGLINTHIHAATAPKDKGFIDDAGARHFYMSSLGENLTALGQAMRGSDYEVFAKFSLAECLKSGNTTIVEISMVPNLGAEKAVKVIDELGIRATESPIVADGIWDRSQAADLRTKWIGLEAGLKKLDEAEKFAKTYTGACGGRLIPAIYGDTVDKCSADLQKAIRAKANELKTPVTIHAGQWVVEFNNMIRMYRRTPIEFLSDTGLLGPDLIVGHGWAIAGHPLVSYPPVDGGDLAILAKSGATVSHDPLVFVKRGNKMHSHTAYLRAGVNVSIGTDTVPQDMLNEMRMASYTSKLADWDCHSGASRDIFNSATLGGAKGLGRSDLGRLTPGALADIAVVDMETFNGVPYRDPVKNLINSSQRADVKWVVVDGKIAVEDSKLTTIDEKKLLRDVQKAGEGIWARIPEHHYLKQTADEVSPLSFKLWEEK
jgi:cytosine/adenosine deaminase-related metal-dependent hydrolase